MRANYTDATAVQLKILLNSGDEIEGVSTRVDLNEDIEPEDEGDELEEDILTYVSNVRFHSSIIKGEVLEANIKFMNCVFSGGLLIENCEVLRRITFWECIFLGPFIISASRAETQIEIMESEVQGAISINNLEGSNSVYVWRGSSEKISFYDCREMSIMLFNTKSGQLSLLNVSGGIVKIEKCILSEVVKIDECILKQLTLSDMFQVPQVLLRDLSVDTFKLEKISSNGLFEIHSLLPSNVTWILSDLKNLKIISCDWSDTKFVCDRTIFAPVSYSDFLFPSISKVNKVGVSSEATRKASVLAQFSASAKAQQDQRMEMRYKSETQYALLAALRSDLREELPRFYTNLPLKVKPIFVKVWKKGLYFFAIYRRDWWNALQLFTNRLTNRFGLSYRRSLGWFVVLSVVFFGGYICSVDENLYFTLNPSDWLSGIEHIWNTHKQQYFYFINPVRRTGFLCANFDCGKVHWSAGLWDFASRIVLVYLSYQFVQAFRKWGR